MRQGEEGAQGARVLSPEPGLARTLSSLARVDAARATSPVPPGSPWWAAEAADLADRAGLPARARAEARQALAKLLEQLDSPEPLPEEAVQAALAVARIATADEPEAARQLRDTIGSPVRSRGSRPRRRDPPGRGRRGREPRKGPGAPGRPALGARSRPRARRALPARAVPVLRPLRPARRREGTGDSGGAAGAGSGLRRAHPLPGPARGPGRPPHPGPGQLSPKQTRGTVPRPGRAPAPVPAGRTTGKLDRGGAGQAVARSQRQGTPDQARPALGRCGPSRRTRPGRAWPRTRLTRTGPPWPPHPGSAAAATGKRPATPTAPTWPPYGRPLSIRGPASRSRPRPPPPKSPARCRIDGPAYLAEALGHVTTSTRPRGPTSTSPPGSAA